MTFDDVPVETWQWDLRVGLPIALVVTLLFVAYVAWVTRRR